MSTTPLLPLFDHLWQSSLFAAAAGLLTLTLRTNRARVRHALWLAASIKFLIPLSVLIALGSHIPWQTGAQTAPPNFAVLMETVSQPFTVTVPLTAVATPAVNALPGMLLAVWACGFLGIAANWWLRWRRITAVVRAGSPVPLEAPIPALASPTLVEPGVFGIFQPVLLLPAGIFERLTPAQLNAVIAHELWHVRHRDNLIAALQMFVETVFWFHPLVWWIGKRMLEERERACDEGVLRQGSEPRVYAEAVLNVCKLYVESPLVCVSGITGANLKRRIEEIMLKRVAYDLHVAKKLGLAAAGIAAVALPIVIGMLHTQPARAQSPAVAAMSPVVAAAPVALAAPQRPHSVTPKAVAMAPQVVQQIAAPPAVAVSPTEGRSEREAYARANFSNAGMVRIYTQYGKPDETIDKPGADPQNPSHIWRYNYLADFHGNVEFEFSTKDSWPVRINWPQPAAIFEGGQYSDNAGLAPILAALSRESPSATLATPSDGLPGRHAAIQVYTWKQLVTLVVPLDSMSGPVDVVGSVVERHQDGTRGMTVANLRDRIDLSQPGAASTEQAQFRLVPGSYDCRVLVREQNSGKLYTEAIRFELK